MTDEQETRLVKIMMMYFIGTVIEMSAIAGIWGTSVIHHMDSMKAELKAEWRKP